MAHLYCVGGTRGMVVEHDAHEVDSPAGAICKAMGKKLSKRMRKQGKGSPTATTNESAGDLKKALKGKYV